MYLEDLLLAMNRIAEYIEGLTFTDFKRDYKTADAVIRNFEIIGEAARNIPPEVKEKYHEVPWDEMYSENHTNSMEEMCRKFEGKGCSFFLKNMSFLKVLQPGSFILVIPTDFL